MEFLYKPSILEAKVLLILAIDKLTLMDNIIAHLLHGNIS